MGWMDVLVCESVGVRWRGWYMVGMGNHGVMYDALVLAHRACPWEDEATRTRTPESCGGYECEAELGAFTDAMLNEMQTGFMVSGSVRGVACD